MSKVCVECGCKVIPSDIQGLYYCPHCEENLNATADVRDYTLFDRITASPEVLADEFIGVMFDHRFTSKYRFYSMLTGDWYDIYEEAIAATVAKLKEVEK